jgi:hypothetical protein
MSAGVKISGVAVVALGLALSSSTAFAAGAGAGAGGDTISVGVSTSSGSPGSGPSSSDGDGDGGGGSGPQCTYTPITLAAAAGFALPVGGPTPGNWFLEQCPGSQADEEGRPVWITTGPSAPPVIAGPGISAKALALQAASSIVLPSPSIRVNPAAFSVVNLPTWLAVDPAVWHRYQATASVGQVSATATATPETVTWSMGDGAVVDCTGPGAQYNIDLAPNLQSTSCAYTYTRSSDGEPSSDGNPDDGAFAVTASVTWAVTWTAVGAAGGGELPSLHTESTEAIRVEQVESIGVGQ